MPSTTLQIARRDSLADRESSSLGWVAFLALPNVITKSPDAFQILFNVIQTLGEITTQYAQRPIVVCIFIRILIWISLMNVFQQKQHGFAMYHPGIDAISSLIPMWPIKFISTTLFNLVIYFLANLKREPGAFFIFLLFTYTTGLLMTSLFRLVAATTNHEATAVSIAGILLLPMIIYTGCKLITI